MSKNVFVKYLARPESLYELKVEKSETIKNLKKRCAELLGLSEFPGYFIIKHKDKRAPQTIENENLTAFEAHIKNEDEIIVAKTEVKGGIKF